MLQLKLLALTLLWWCTNNINIVHGEVANSQTHLLNKGCSTYNVSDLSSFSANINATFSRLSDQVSNENKYFATADEARGSVRTFTMFQCRNYLSKSECVDCFNTATSQIRNCSAANGARVIYDGCFLRYESNTFYDQTTKEGNDVSCGNTSTKTAGFRTTGQQLLKDLETATPKIKGFYAATKTKVAGDGAIYAVAQCVETATESDCLKCMQVGYNNLHTCLPNTEGSAYDAGCFMRYSTTPFFADNQTIDITPYLNGSIRGSNVIEGQGSGVTVRAMAWDFISMLAVILVNLSMVF